MAQAELVAEHKGMLQQIKDKFTATDDADFKRHLDVAASDLARVKPTYKTGRIDLVAGQSVYAAPSDIKAITELLWGRDKRRELKPWDKRYPVCLPTLILLSFDSNQLILQFSSAPTSQQIFSLSTGAEYRYLLDYKIDPDAGNTTVPVMFKSLLLIRATAAALFELANQGISRPMELGPRGVGGMPKNGTPAALAESAMKLFESMAKA